VGQPAEALDAEQADTQRAEDPVHQEIAKTTKFFDRIIVAFFFRQSPASSRPKPAFMKNTKNAVKIVQAVSAPTFSSSGVM
jgi:ribosomal silencing factor RsfS